ncbi:MAG TPA: IS110 family transposase [Hyphomicrobiaceae bacterium]|nr:IS110 family transposase [Hyphomicrobiaceae bacterium]
MKHYAGIDVSLEVSHVCVIDEAGRVVKELVASSDPLSLEEALSPWRRSLGRMGLEAGPLSQWLHAGLAAAGFPVDCLETRHLQAVLSTSPVKTDRKDAHGIAQVVRMGWYRRVHVKSHEAQERLALVTARKLLVNKLTDVENGIRGLLRGFGLKVGQVGKVKFAPRVRDLLAQRPGLQGTVEPLLKIREEMRTQLARLDGQVRQVARQDERCRRLMSMPGIGPVVALTYQAALDEPGRFAHSKSVGPYFGLTPARYKSGEIDYSGHISKCGDELVRTALYEAATTLLCRVARWSALKAWAVRVAKRRGFKRACVALARKMAVVLHRMWQDGTEFRWSKIEIAA